MIGNIDRLVFSLILIYFFVEMNIFRGYRGVYNIFENFGVVGVLFMEILGRCVVFLVWGMDIFWNYKM